MREIRTSGSTSGTWKRSASRHRATSRLYPVTFVPVTFPPRQDGLQPGESFQQILNFLEDRRGVFRLQPYADCLAAIAERYNAGI